MTHDTFNELVNKLESTRVETLKNKNARYNPYDDAIGNFHSGAEIMGVTTAQCIWGYATKHIVALRDKILHDDFSDLDDTLEKIQDIQNYLTFIWCAANEASKEKTVDVAQKKHFNENICYGCNMLCDIDSRCCECCKYGSDKFDDGFNEKLQKATNEPCASCRNNFVIGTEEYKNAPFNWEASNG